MPAYCRAAAYDAFAIEFRELDTTTGLFRAAFAIARHEHPDADVDQAEATIAELADTVSRRVHSANLDAKLAHLHDVLFDVVGFVGNVDDYYDPANSYLPEVLRTHRGLPITLVLIYKCVAERIGLDVRGINSPGHFLAAVKSSDLTARPRRRRRGCTSTRFTAGRSSIETMSAAASPRRPAESPSTPRCGSSPLRIGNGSAGC